MCFGVVFKEENTNLSEDNYFHADIRTQNHPNGK